MKYFMIILMVGWAQVMLAQNRATISGTITDQSNGETLIGANIFLQNENNEITNGTATNVYGFYSLTAPTGSYRLVVSY